MNKETVEIYLAMIGQREKYYITARNFKTGAVKNLWLTKEKLLETLSQLEADGYTVWSSINELEEGNATINGVKRYCTLWFDIDSKRKDKNTPATTEEVLEARSRAINLRNFLQERFRAKCFIALSGNGIHLFAPFECTEVPEDKREQLNANLQAFAKAVSKIAGAEIDHTYDTRRVTAIIGLKNQKIPSHPLETGWEKELYDPQEGRDVNYALQQIETARKQNAFLREIIMNYDTLSETFGLTKLETPVTQPAAPVPDAPFTPEVEARLEELKKKNPKLAALLDKRVCIEKEPETMKEPCEYRYPSRSEAEEALLVLLVYYGFSKTQIDEIMKTKSQIGKWKERDDKYRELSYNKAVEYCAQHKALLLADQQQPQSEAVKEITGARFEFENGHLYRIIETPLLTIKIGEKKLKYISENKTFEMKLTFDMNNIEKELETADATPEEITYFKRVTEAGIKENYILAKEKEDTLPRFAAEIADVFLKNFHFVTIAETKEILIYENGIYKEGAEAFIENQIENIVPPEAITKNLIEEVLGHIQRSTYVPLEQINSNPYILNFKNGLFNIRTFELKPHSPEFISTIQIPVEYKPEAKCELWEKVVSEDLYPEDVEILREAFGYALFPDNRAQKMFIFLGAGSNGKSLILHVLQELLGKQNVANVSPQTLATNNFALSELKDKLVNLYADLPSFTIFSTGNLKALVSGDRLLADVKYKKPFHLRNRAKFFFSANVLPKVTDNTVAFFRRLIIIPFPKTFDENNADPELFDKLTTPEALSGILNWALEGLKHLMQNNFKFSYTKTVDEIMEQYTRASDPIKAFLDEETIEDPEAWIPKQELYSAYVDYVNSQKLQAPVSQTTFFRNLLKYRKLATERKNVKGERIFAYIGIRLKNAREKEEENENEQLPLETQ